MLRPWAEDDMSEEDKKEFRILSAGSPHGFRKLSPSARLFCLRRVRRLRFVIFFFDGLSERFFFSSAVTALLRPISTSRIFSGTSEYLFASILHPFCIKSGEGYVAIFFVAKKW
jgi:hypothetical protein